MNSISNHLNKSNEFCLFLASLKKTKGEKNLIIAKDNKELKYLHRIAKSFFKEDEIVVFDHWQTLFYDDISPSLKIINQRIQSLNKIIKNQYCIILSPLEALISPVCDEKFILQNSFNWKVKDRIDLNLQLELFEKSGYQRVSQVDSEGQFAIRGSLIDVFLIGSKNPIRLDLFDDEIETIRSFDVQTQQTIKLIDEVKIFPIREFNLNQNSADIFKSRYYELTQSPVPNFLYEKIKSNYYHPGLENYLPLFSKKNTYLFDYFLSYSGSIQISYEFNLEARLASIQRGIESRFSQALSQSQSSATHSEKSLIPITPSNFYLSKNQFIENSQKFNSSLNSNGWNFEFFSLSENLKHKNDTDLSNLKKLLNLKNKVLFSVNSASKIHQLTEFLNSQIQNLPSTIKSYSHINDFLNSNIDIGIINSYFQHSIKLQNESQNIIIISEFDYYETDFNLAFLDQSIDEQKKYPKFKIDPLENHFELIEGCTVVHEDYGIGQYLGLEKIKIDGAEGEYLRLAYANNSQVLVPVADISLIGRYKSTAEGVELSQIGSKKWQGKKQKIATKIKEMAIEILASEAKRLKAEKPPYVLDKQYKKFASEFMYEETDDQKKAIEEVISDLTSNKIMNRLISGDVGFGKTEIAMRAAFIAVNSGKKVIILTPTTLLNQQHTQNFLDRFSGFDINIANMSRLLSEKQNKINLKRFEQGEIDILIGTHKILSSQIQSKNIGLMIIDEEHRFGVAHKEKIKKMRSDLNVLTMTATPIPRTLNMAMNRLQDISIIASPPKERLSINTNIIEWDNEILKKAVEREIHRAGQIYWVHNNIATIHKVKKEIESLIPKAKIGVAHGQMNKDEIDKVMYHFFTQNIDILLCTTIIETGIDIANANTIIINNAHKLGLSQLYQLRGRVGRSFMQAYAYLVIDSENLLKKDAKRRLEAMQKANYLGAGFELASFDLEIRGSGDLLGKMQSGNIDGIGLDLYQKLLNKTIHALERGEDFDFDNLEHKVEVDLNTNCYLPENYINDMYLRLVFYKKISNCDSFLKVDDIYKELIDRFGILPAETKNLLLLQKIKVLAEKIGIKKISQSISFELRKNHKFNINKVIEFIQKNSSEYKLTEKAIEYKLIQTKNTGSVVQTTLDCLEVFEKDLVN